MCKCKFLYVNETSSKSCAISWSLSGCSPLVRSFSSSTRWSSSKWIKTLCSEVRLKKSSSNSTPELMLHTYPALLFSIENLHAFSECDLWSVRSDRWSLRAGERYFKNSVTYTLYPHPQGLYRTVWYTNSVGIHVLRGGASLVDFG